MSWFRVNITQILGSFILDAEVTNPASKVNIDAARGGINDDPASIKPAPPRANTYYRDYYHHDEERPSFPPPVTKNTR